MPYFNQSGDKMGAKNITNEARYSKGAFFIIIQEFCERFSFHGMKAVLALYLTNFLHYDTNTSTVFYHIFVMLCYICPLFGAVIADSFWGRYKTILYFSLVHALGNIIISVGAIPVLPVSHGVVSLLGLLFLAVGTGGIKPCVPSFGGDQFILPQQTKQLQQFFSIFYFGIYAGSMISSVLIPNLRTYVKCFGEDSCFSLAFGVPAIFMITALVIFVLGKPLYRIEEPSGHNMLVAFLKCIFHAVKNRILRKNNARKTSHFLEYANDKYTDEEISDFQSVLNALYLFLTVPVYWALSEQQSSKWVYQATYMEGRILGYTITPDLMQMFNPLLFLILVPLFEVYIYPFLKKIGVKGAPQKLVIGGCLAVLSFLISAAIEYKIRESSGVVPVNKEAQLRIFNSLNCDLTLNPPIQNMSTISALSALELLHIPTIGSNKYQTVFSTNNKCPHKLNEETIQLEVYEKRVTSYFVTQTSSDIKIIPPSGFENLVKDTTGRAKIRIFYGSLANVKPDLILQNTVIEEKRVLGNYVKINADPGFFSILPGRYNLILDSTNILPNIDINPGEINTIIVRENSSYSKASIINMVPSNNIHILWQLPQIIIFAVGDVIFCLTGPEISFTQAPSSMKSILHSAWLLTFALGNLIVAIISKLGLFDSQVYEFLFYIVLMVIDVVVLMFLCSRYEHKYVEAAHSNEKSDSKISDGQHTSQMSLST